MEQLLSYQFQQPQLLEQAITHCSFVHEAHEGSLLSYERLEFLGDAVLELVISHYLWERYPDLDEGDLTKMRAELVKKSTLASIAQNLQISSFLRLGRGERLQGGTQRNSILADTIEAILGAVFLDGGFSAAQCVCLQLFAPKLQHLNLDGIADHKNRLQELAANLQLPPPEYKFLRSEGPEHDSTFVMEVSIYSFVSAEGYGSNKKAASQQAALKLLEQLQPLLDQIKLHQDKSQDKRSYFLELLKSHFASNSHSEIAAAKTREYHQTEVLPNHDTD